MKSDFNFYELKASNRLPSPSGTALAIMKMVQSQNPDVVKVIRLVQSDPALSGRILRLANSAAFAIRRPIVDIQEAVARVGLLTVKNFALSLSLVSKSRSGLCENFDYELFWAESLATAVALSSITLLERTVVPEEAFTLGLLSGIGRLALATVWPDEYSQCLQEAGEHDLLAKENEYFSVDHHALSIQLLDDWGLPSVFLDALKQVHGRTESGDRRIDRLALQLTFAKAIGRYCISHDRISLLPNLIRLGESNRLDAENVQGFLDEILENWRSWGEGISVDTGVRIRPELAAVQTTMGSLESQSNAGIDILFIGEGDKLSRELLGLLRTEGFHCVVCDNEDSALEYVGRQLPGMILLERNIPVGANEIESSGLLEFCKTLRSFPHGNKIYLIVLSNSDSESNLIEAFGAGVDDYITLPVGHRLLLARIRAGQRIASLQLKLRREHEALEKASSDLALANRKLRHLANTDMLTALPNRRYALKRLENEWITSLRTRFPISVLMMDLDNFKEINDKLGHDGGDKVLIHLAKLLNDRIRAGDVVGRLGGEEFLVIAPNADRAAALSLAERIRSEIEKKQPEHLVLPRPLTVSIGVAWSVGGKPHWQSLLKLADDALYKAKNSGKNSVVLSEAYASC